MSDPIAFRAPGGTGEQPHAGEPPSSYSGRTRYTQLEYEAILANASIGIAFTRDRKFFLCNPRFAEMFGWGPGELIGQSGGVVYPSRESYEALAQIAIPILSAGGQLDLEWELRRKDGSSFMGRMIAKAIDPENTQQGTIWIVDDITERKRHRDDLDRLLREQEAILGTAAVGIVFVRDGRIVRCNQRYAQMYGYEPGELNDQPTSVVYADPRDHEAVGEVYEHLAKGLTYRRVQLRRRKDGTTMWVRTDGRAVEPHDPQRGSVWTVEDITEQKRAEDERGRLLAEQQALLNNLVVGICFTRGRKIMRCNRRFEELFGYEPGAMLGLDARAFYFTDDEYQLRGSSYDELDRGETHTREQFLRKADGSGIFCRISGRAVEPGTPEKGYVWLFEDATERKRADESAQRLMREQNAVLENAMIGIVFLKDGRVVRCNRRFEELFGYEQGELLNESTRVLYAREKDFERIEKKYSRIWRGETYVDERRMVRKGGAKFWCHLSGRAVAPGDPAQGSVWLFDDVTAERDAREALERAVTERTAELKSANEQLEAEITERKQAEERARHLAGHDALTGLPNRRLLEDRLTQALALSYRNRKQTAVMFIDLDRFKMINDSLGHAVGDLLLQEVAQRLVKLMRVGDTICRIGGDEFVIVLPEIKRSSDAANVAQKVIEQLSATVVIDGRELHVTPSIGITVFPDDGRDAEALIGNADAAMYHAKEMGRANYQFFTDQMNLAASRRLTLENDLRRALHKGELAVYYQPVTELKAGCVAAHEALVRWQHPTKGLVGPNDFILLAEETGLIVPIGAWVLREACRWATFIGTEHGLPVSVNLSARQFADPKIVETVRQVLRDTGLPARLLELEITESTAMQQTDVALATMTRLKALGVTLAIDDFGTGYSSLAYLKRFPVDKLKIDRSFVADLPGDKDNKAIVAAIIALAHALNIRVVAEGVETEEQLEFLDACHCDFIQGYLAGPPVDADAAAKEYV
jgi:diguanylate cyclase (GGDEF)-like protein/PAS domain S-box-containing protein